jgi:hypothetical protein
MANLDSAGYRICTGLSLVLISLSLLSFMFPKFGHYLMVQRFAQAAAAKTKLVRKAETAVQTKSAPSVAAKHSLRYQTRSQLDHLRETRRLAGNEQVILNIIRELDDQLSLPFDISVSLEECGQPDAFYDPDSHQITICYEIIDSIETLFSREVKQRSRRNEAVAGALSSMFLHEVGHALIDAWKLPVTGRQEDAVDQFSTLILVSSGREGERMALTGARIFKLFAKVERHQGTILWDEHSPDAQRYYDMMCLIYGHDPQEYTYLVTTRALPAERAENCSDEYQRVRNSWQRLLEPYSKLSLEIR